MAYSLLDLRPAKPGQPRQTESFDIIGGDDTSIDHGAADHRFGQSGRPGQVTDKSSRKRVPRSCRIKYRFQKKSGNRKSEIFGKTNNAVLPFFDHRQFGAAAQDQRDADSRLNSPDNSRASESLHKKTSTCFKSLSRLFLLFSIQKFMVSQATKCGFHTCRKTAS